MRHYPHLAFALIGALSAHPASAQLLPIKPIQKPPVPMPQTKPLKMVAAAPITLVAPVRVTRAGKLNAAQFRARRLQVNASVRPGKPMVMQMMTVKIPGIAGVNGANSGDLSPGGDYEISGTQFGTGGGTVLLRHGSGRIIPLSVNLWSDTVIYVHVPDDVSGLRDGPAELLVAPAGKAPFKSSKFGFFAARADVDLNIPDAWFQHEGGAEVYRPRLEHEGKFYSVSRHSSDYSDRKVCIEPGRDRIGWGGLTPGFEITAYYFSHMDFNRSIGSASLTPRGKFEFAWEGDSIRIDYGVMRIYQEKFLLVGGGGSCESYYKVNLVATGPRGVPPL